MPSASLIPHDPTVLFTIAGMVPFKPYFLGEEPAPWPRATSVQKCFRTVDIDIVGSTDRHCTFFEMLGNFSFGDYFKDRAIEMAWELVTEVLGIDPERLWATVYQNDDEAAELWTEAVGLPQERVQKMGEDNFWRMGETGPCGPSSEIYFDKGDAFGEAGGPSRGGAERYVEIWNLVFMQSNRRADGTVEDLPRRNIDTGAGLERILPIVQGKDSLFATDLMLPVLQEVEDLSGHHYGADAGDDVAIRILTDHARAMAMLVADGVLPSNEGRGYVLRRVIRRALLRAERLGVTGTVTPRLARAAASTLGAAYPDLVAQLDLVSEVLEREEGRFRSTLASGSAILAEFISTGMAGPGDSGPAGAAPQEDLPGGGAASEPGGGAASERGGGAVSEPGGGAKVVPGELAFRLHDTYGFPVELTAEIAAEAGLGVDMEGFESHMADQRTRARAATKAARMPGGEESYRLLADEVGPSAFVGYSEYQAAARVVAVLAGSEPDRAEVILDRTPFYAEAGGQVGDRGVVTTETGRAYVLDTQKAPGGLVVHHCRLEGMVEAGQDALAVIDAERREATRRNHTGTHLLHSALRQVLGDHVRQQGSLVGPDRLRFDFSSPRGLRPEEIDEVVALANADVLADSPVRVFETSKAEAEALGALAFFGDKYGERVRVVEAGRHSVELCGGTHVDSLGMIGPITVLSESSIGSASRRIEAMSGQRSLALFAERRRMLEEAARLLKVEPDGVPEAIERLIERQRQAEQELARLARRALEEEAASLVLEAIPSKSLPGSVVVSRRDGLDPDGLRHLADEILRRGQLVAVVLAGSPDGARATIAVASNSEVNASSLVKELAAHVGGGGGGSEHLAVAGGRDPAGIPAAILAARVALGTGEGG